MYASFICQQDALVLYGKLQLKLVRGATDGSVLLEQLMDIVGKELDQISTSTTSLPWYVLLFGTSIAFIFIQVVFWSL